MVEIRIPDIGADSSELIELHVAVGDSVAVEDALVTLESDKASMELPSPEAGVIKEICLKIGDKVSEGDLLIKLEVASAAVEAAPAEVAAPVEAAKPAEAAPAPAAAPVAAAVVASGAPEPVTVPDIGSDGQVDVIEVHVAVGDVIEAEQAIITLESDKASMEIPAPAAGKVTEIKVVVGDKVSLGDLVLMLEPVGAASAPAPVAESAPAPVAPAEKAPVAQAASPAAAVAPANVQPVNALYQVSSNIYASPAVRRLANRLGVNLTQVKGSGRSGRIKSEDVEAFVKQTMTQVQSGQTPVATSGAPVAGNGLQVADFPKMDFSKFGDVEVRPLNKIKRLTANFLHRNWVTIPHVTQFDEADITEMEAFRKAKGAKLKEQGIRLTPLVFMMKAAVHALQAEPEFNASLDETGENLVLKQYYHIGVAVDTPNGLVVPVIRDVDQKSLIELAEELGEISVKARKGLLKPSDMSGGCFTISSLGGIGGTSFTPIVNWPDVGILGISRSQMKPVWNGKEFEPRLMLPLALSYDHRVVDGAQAARFIVTLSAALNDLRNLLL
ncbi:dihydrolipoyllysine-residue acetyltransferase [Pelagibaculum spongiae]|uniref:Acetyltransferase component of pyruvate dehydrogenase complex n=1 Tax=Pelagibaculum spongiae TaxID=2080658 RepID=A0A2V1GXZ6_9GAMM|nr:dihydrolipoyllysine-residue acetyltransferase [Pelagibaculum spongiae]PVZ71954.1 dihydrolipoyllysine-residue acetyltransferase [Pelagibaculum spongiae]